MTRRRGTAIPTPPSGRDELRRIIRANVPVMLGGYLRRLARASVVAGSLAAGSLAAGSLAAGCATSHFPPGPELTAPTCTDGSWQAAEGLSLQGAHDYVGVLEYQGFAPEAWVIDEDGTPCAGASDAAACEASRADILANTYGRYVLTTTGDVARAHDSDEEMRELLGPIDTPSEALLRVWQSGYNVRCDDLSRSGVREVEGGYEVVATSSRGGCGEPVIITRHLFFVETDGTMTSLATEDIERIDDPGCAGRRPEGLAPAGGAIAPDPVGRWLASMARLERSAVDAFATLATELELHGAPPALAEEARAAADDEVRHFHVTSGLARRYGAEPLACEVARGEPRSLFAVALENAVEGCVRETYGALVAHHQALSAADREVARAFAAIAEDETRHAELSWKIASWIEPRLDEAERRELALARARAVAELRAEMQLATDPELVRVAGLPDARAAVALLDHVTDTLWA